jgi:L-amino acid N-acyltransferase YncA
MNNNYSIFIFKNNSMLIRDAVIEDLPAIVAIYNSTVDGRMVTADMKPVAVADKEQWFHEHTPDRRPLWMVEKEDRTTLGWVSFQDFYGRPAYDGTAEISIYLNEKARGKGLRKKLLEYSFTKCAELNIHTLLGFIFAHNEPSIRLFLQLGFEEWGDLRDVAIMDNKNYSLKIFGKKI